MLENEPQSAAEPADSSADASAAPPRRRRRAVSRPAGAPQGAAAETAETVLPAESQPAQPQAAEAE
ncbi:hypothetical protein, partial [Kitasatospora sp. NPDC059571]|uniref:hypothetical protein n=1 Tax=Kitasatospora sp. NPDC059571 TaxID=3346871 RepID=UPI0036A516F3